MRTKGTGFGSLENAQIIFAGRYVSNEHDFVVLFFLSLFALSLVLSVCLYSVNNYIPYAIDHRIQVVV